MVSPGTHLVKNRVVLTVRGPWDPQFQKVEGPYLLFWGPLPTITKI